jgi:hypothetical protein
MKKENGVFSNERVYVVYIQENQADEWKKWGDLARLAKTNTMRVGRYFVSKEQTFYQVLNVLAVLEGEVC